MEKETTELMRELISEKDIERFAGMNQALFQTQPLTEYLSFLLKLYNIKKSEVIKQSGLTGVYGYQIFDGRREPSRDKVLQLAFGLQLNLEETKKLLKCAGQGELYPRVKRDALLIYAITNAMSIYDTEELLYKMGEQGFLE